MRSTETVLSKAVVDARRDWKSHIEVCDGFTEQMRVDGAQTDDQRFTDIMNIRASLVQLLSILDDVESETLELGKARHDINGVLMVTRSNLTFVIEDEKTIDDDPASLLDLRSTPLQYMFEEMEETRKSLETALMISKLEIDPSMSENFELPEGTTTLMIDDDKRVISAFEKLFSEKDLRFHAVKDDKDLTDWIADNPGAEVNLILLDDQIGGTLRGHTLIDELQAAYPDAKIVAHTGNMKVINSNGENQYSKRGLPVVPKLKLTAIQKAFEGK